MSATEARPEVAAEEARRREIQRELERKVFVATMAATIAAGLVVTYKDDGYTHEEVAERAISIAEKILGQLRL
jgi:hypothetical protein